METVTPSDLERVERKLDDILEAINGNGRPGMKTEIALLKAEIESIKEKQARAEAEKQAASKDLKSIVAPLITQFLGAGIALAVYVVAGHALGILH